MPRLLIAGIIIVAVIAGIFGLSSGHILGLLTVPILTQVTPTPSPTTQSKESYVLSLAQTELGCSTKAACGTFCNQIANKARCDAFRQKYGSAPNPSPTKGTVATGGQTIGYIGCSNSANSVNGYQNTAGKKLIWNAYSTGSGAITMWADSNSNFWTYYDQQVAKYGQPQKVWVQLCEPYGGAGITDYAHVKLMLANLKARSPDATPYISAINVYDPRVGTCALMGAGGQGETDTETWRDQAVRDGLAKRGPDMGPLTVSNTVADHCHPNPAGETLLGTQLHNFFDNL